MRKRLQILSLVAASLFATNAMAQRYVTNVFPNIKTTSNVVFGQNFSVLTGQPVLSDLRLDFYEPDGDTSTSRPLVVYLHTGSFLPKGINQLPTGSKTDSAAVEMCMQFAKKGYVVAAVAYRTGWNPQGDQDTRTGTILNAVYRAMQDTKTAIRYFRYMGATNPGTYKVDTNRIVICGQGSGGYVALAAATLNKVSEIQLQKFINQTNNTPYVLQQVVGDFDGFGGNPVANKGDNYVGYSSKANMVVNFGGAMGDSSWLEAGDIPIVSIQGKLDPFAPYTTGGVFVPGTNPPLFVVEVSGARDISRRADRLGVNNDLKSPAFNDPYTTAANNYNEGIPALFRINGAANASGPWEWWDPADPFDANGKASNPLMSKSRALLYIDTLQGFFTPRMKRILFDLNTGVNTLAKENVKIYPNPASNVVTIEIPNLNNEVYSVAIVDAMGRVVLEEKNIAVSSKTIETSNLNNGFYFVRLNSGAESRVEKIIINR